MKSLLLAATFLSFALGATVGELAEHSVRIALKDYTRSGSGVEFSEDGRSMCVWWGPVPPVGDYTKLPLELVIFDMLGNVLSISRSSTNRAVSIKDFPTIGWRETQQEFVKDAMAWAFARDLSKGLRIKEIRYNKHLAEMWELPAKDKPLWLTTLPYVNPRPVSLFFDITNKTILVQTTGQEVVALDLETGKVADEFSLGPIETDIEVLKRKKKFGIRLDDDDPGLRFFASTLSLNSKKQLLASGSSNDKRVKVVGIASRGQMVFEANAEISPVRPWGGDWRVRRVQFLADGKYLLAEYKFGGRGTSTVLEPTEIFETRTWKVVWKENDLEIRSVTMSADGNKIAFLRGNILEVHPFESR